MMKPEIIEQIVEMYKSGKLVKQIASELNIGEGSVYGYAKIAGLRRNFIRRDDFLKLIESGITDRKEIKKILGITTHATGHLFRKYARHIPYYNK